MAKLQCWCALCGHQCLAESCSEQFQALISKSQVLRSPFPDHWQILQAVTLIAQTEWGSSADSRGLGCAVALYFGLLTVSLTRYPASLDFFATPGITKHLKHAEALSPCGHYFLSCFGRQGWSEKAWIEMMVEFLFLPRPQPGWLWYQSAGGLCSLCSCSEGRIGVGGATLENIK